MGTHPIFESDFDCLTEKMAAIDVKSTEEFNSFIAADQLVCVEFFAASCGPCKLAGPYIARLTEEFPRFKMIFLKVDVDEHGELAKSQDIKSMPTFIFYKNGKRV